MAANPNPAPKRNRKIVLVHRDPNACYACGRNVNSHDVLTGPQMLKHIRSQEYNSFRVVDDFGAHLVHFTQAQKEVRDAEFRARAAQETQTPANALETAPVVREKASRLSQWYALETRIVAAYPRSAWLVTLAIAYFAEGKHLAGSDALATFRREVARERMAQQASLEDYRDAVEMQRAA